MGWGLCLSRWRGFWRGFEGWKVWDSLDRKVSWQVQRNLLPETSGSFSRGRGLLFVK